MSISRALPQTNIACQKALNTAVAQAKISSKVLSADTNTRLNTENTNFDAAMNLVIDTKQAQRTASAAAVAGKAKFRIFFSSYFTVLNCGIDMEVIPRAARAYYDIDINNNRQPVINSDADLLICGQRVIDGDAKRVLAGGIAMGFPTIAEYTVVFNACKIAISVFSASKLTVLQAEAARKGLNKSVKNINIRVSNEVETYYSELDASAMRAASRLFGVKYISHGLPAFITGIVTNEFNLKINKTDDKIWKNKSYTFNINSTNINGSIKKISEDTIKVTLESYQYIEDKDIITISVNTGGTGIHLLDYCKFDINCHHNKLKMNGEQ